MLQALNLTKTIEHQSDRDPAKGTENATVFVLGALSSRVASTLRDKSTRFSGDVGKVDGVITELRMNETAFELVRFGLKGFRNYQAADGTMLEFKTEEVQVGGTIMKVVAKEIMDAIDLETIRELAEVVGKVSGFEEAEVKN